MLNLDAHSNCRAYIQRMADFPRYGSVSNCLVWASFESDPGKQGWSEVDRSIDIIEAVCNTIFRKLLDVHSSTATKQTTLCFTDGFIQTRFH